MQTHQTIPAGTPVQGVRRAIRPRAQRRHRFGRIGALVLGVVIVAIIAARLVLPYAVQRYVTQVLNRDRSYRGEIGDITIHLWRGAYRIENLRIEKAGGKVPVPLFYAPGIDLSVEWKALFDGALVGEVELEKPSINFVNGESGEETQTGEEQDWTKVIRDLFPLRIDRFAVTDGSVHYRDFSTEPKVDVRLTDFYGAAKNLTNLTDISKSLVATGEARATLEKEAPVHLVMEIDPYAADPTFHATFEMHKLNITRLNDLFQAYANVDAKKGTMHLFADITADKGEVDGMLKPLIVDLELLQWKEDKDRPLHYMWQLMVSAAAEIFTNQHKDQIALVIPVKGNFKQPDTKGWPAFVSLLGNAFIRAIRPGLEDIRREKPEGSGG